MNTEAISNVQLNKLKELTELYSNYEPKLLIHPDWKIIGKEYYVPDALKVLDRVKLGKSYSDLNLIAYKPREYEFETILAWYNASPYLQPMEQGRLVWLGLACHAFYLCTCKIV